MRRSVWGHDMKIILCNWHVKRNWLRHLIKKVSHLPAAQLVCVARLLQNLLNPKMHFLPRRPSASPALW